MEQKGARLLRKNGDSVDRWENAHMSQYAQSRQKARKADFKKGIEGAEQRKKREENAVRIRKEKRIESFQKKRNVGGGSDGAFEDVCNQLILFVSHTCRPKA